MDATSSSTGTDTPRRAVRYAIEAPVRVRVGADDWLAGTTVNIARLGMLLRTSSFAPSVSSGIDVCVMLCATEHADSCSVVACSGRVVRVEPATDGSTIVAVTIDDYEMRPRPSPAVRRDEAPAENWWTASRFFFGREPRFV